MKKIVTLFLVFFIQNYTLFAQDKIQCQDIVKETITAINAKNAENLTKYLSDDFSIAGQQGTIAKMVLKKLVQQLNDSVLNFELISETKKEKLTLVYDLTYKLKGKKVSKFTFNSSNQLHELELFEMKVKTMKNDQTTSNPIKENSIEIPFKLFGKLLAVDVIIDNVKKTFLLDNGAPKMILNNHYYKSQDSLNIKNSISNAQGVNGSIAEMDIVKINKIDFYGIVLENKELITMNLEHLEKELGKEIHGLLGNEIYKDYDLFFDYKESKLFLIAPNFTKIFIENNFKNKKLIELPIEMNAHIATINASIGDKIYKLGIDCGAETNLLDTKHYKSLKKYYKNSTKESLIGADQLVKEVVSAKINQLKIGSLIFEDTKTNFNDLNHLNNGYKINLDGLIGYEILSKQKTILSYKNSKLIFIE